MFIVFMRDIQYIVKKKGRAETDLKSVLPQKYYDFLDDFLKKASDTLPPYQKYDHKIQLEKKQKPGHRSLYKMFLKESNAVKQYFDSHRAKRFIQVSSASYFLPLLFVK